MTEWEKFPGFESNKEGRGPKAVIVRICKAWSYILIAAVILYLTWNKVMPNMSDLKALTFENAVWITVFIDLYTGTSWRIVLGRELK